MYSRRWAVCLCLLVAACAARTKPAFVPTQPFNDTDFAWSASKGRGTVTGQAFLKTVGGDVKTCAGNEVSLVPDNSYTEEIHSALQTNRYGSAVYDPRYYQFRRTTTCDAEGRFSFSDLPSGKWFVNVLVQWGAPSSSGILPQGGYLSRHVETKDGTTEKLILTDRDLIERL
jgi:hypothetical protein